MQRDDSLLHFAHYHKDYQCKSVLGLMFFTSLTLILSDIFFVSKSAPVLSPQTLIAFPFAKLHATFFRKEPMPKTPKYAKC